MTGSMQRLDQDKRHFGKTQRKWVAWAVLGLLLAMSVQSGFAQANFPIDITSGVDRSAITIGDLVHYEITVRRDKNVQVFWPGLASNLGAFEIRDYQVDDPKKADGRFVERIRYTISTFDTGKFVIPPLKIEYAVLPDSTRHVLKTEPIEIQVASLRPSLEGDIRGLKPQEELPRDWKVLLSYIAFGFIAILIFMAIWLYIRYRRTGESPFVKPAPPRPAHELALEALRQLQAAKLLEKGAVKEHFSRLSEILRMYVEGRFFIPALELTTYELMQRFAQESHAQVKTEPVHQVLSLCDLVKFAKYHPSADESDNIFAQTVEFIQATKLVYQEDDGADAPKQGGAPEVAPETAEAAVDAEEAKP